MKNQAGKLSAKEVIDPSDADWAFDTHSDGPKGKLPYTEELLINEPSGFHFGMSQSAGMGWNPNELLRNHFLNAIGKASVKTPIETNHHQGFEPFSKNPKWDFGQLNIF